MSLIGKGAHRAVAISEDVQHGFSPTKATPQVVVPLRIIAGPDRGRIITYFGYFSEKAEDRTMESLRLMGWKGDDVCDLGELPNEVSVVVDHEKYNGKVTAKVQWVNSPGGRGKIKLEKPMDDAMKRQFSAKMRGAAKRAAVVEGAPPDLDSLDVDPMTGGAPDTEADLGDSYGGAPPNENGDPGPGNSDDIPF